MKSYTLLVVVVYSLVGMLANTLLKELHVEGAFLIALSATVIALVAHFIMEGLVVTDDLESKVTFTDHLSDAKYCAAVGALSFIPLVLIGSGLSLVINTTSLTGVILMGLGGCIFWVGCRYANA